VIIAVFPVAAAALMVSPQQNNDVKVPALWAAYFNGSIRVNGTVLGDVLAATKAKPFVIDHPTKENKKLVHVALEGPENGVYVRGKLNNSCIIELPEYWSKFVDPDTITVNLTPIARFQQLYVEKIENNKIYVRNTIQANRINCHYHVYAERADIEKLKIEVDPEEYGI
jgi:hypothetical protein